MTSYLPPAPPPNDDVIDVTSAGYVTSSTSGVGYGTFVNFTSWPTPTPRHGPSTSASTFSCDNVTLFNEYFTYCSREFVAISNIKLYSLPLFVVVGSVGNMSCLAVLSRKAVMKSSMTFYMAVLLLVHTAVLYMGCGLEWYSFVTHEIHFLHTVDWFCRFFNFSFSVIRCAAWWILVAMTINCHLAVWCPATARSVCTLFVAKFITTAIFVWLVSLHVHAMWIYELKNGVCVLDTSRQDFETIVWPWITAIFSHYLPILLVLTFLVLLAVGSLAADRSQFGGDEPADRKRFGRLTMVMATVFLSTTLPTIIMNFIDQSRPAWQISDQPRHWKKHSQYILWQVIFSTLESFYVSSCFLLFFVAVPALRHELRHLIRGAACCSRRRTTADDDLLNAANDQQLLDVNNVKPQCQQNDTTTLV